MDGVAVVTGASAGVGRATTRALARAGWNLGLLARGEDGLKAAVEEVEALGVRAIAVPTDVADAAAVDEAATAVEEEFGPIDAWVNCAMTAVFGYFVEVPMEDFRRVTEVTYLGYVHGTRAALSRMRSRDRGVIVQVGSALAYRGIPLQSAYCGAKHAIQGFTDSVRAELHHEGSGILRSKPLGEYRRDLPHIVHREHRQRELEITDIVGVHVLGHLPGPPHPGQRSPDGGQAGTASGNAWMARARSASA